MSGTAFNKVEEVEVDLVAVENPIPCHTFADPRTNSRRLLPADLEARLLRGPGLRPELGRRGLHRAEPARGSPLSRSGTRVDRSGPQAWRVADRRTFPLGSNASRSNSSQKIA